MTLVGLLNSLIRIFGDPYLRFKVKQIIFRVPANDALRNTEGDNPRDESMTERSMHQEETKSLLLIAAIEEEESKRSVKGISAGMGSGQEEMLA